MKGKIEIVQLLRGIAALLVCFFHMKGILNHGSSQLGTFLFGSGSIGVPLFFMISGFIMVVTTQNSSPTFAYVKGYYLKRAVRILPIYYILTLVLVLGLGEFRYYFIDHYNELLSGLFFFPTYQNHIGPSYGMPPLEVGWSLCYEVFFYILLGVSIFFGRYRWTVLVGLMAVLVYLIPFITNGEVMPLLSGCYGYTSAYFSLMTNPVILFFIVGVLIGLFYISRHSIPNILLSQCLAGIAIVVFILSYFGLITLPKSYYSNILVCGLLLFALLQRNKIKPFVLPKPLVFLGDMSYSLYLVHPLVIIFLPRIFRIFKAGVILASPWYFLIVMSVVLGLSVISYNLIEKQLCSRLISLLVVRHPLN
ncbi:acyltransferase [uncultured Acetobacteroides sp.]|uniref:acyltransferase family protein n=1 Tax=uncultured Acetobacteroides sp. TaxID=1760811 RepID=UPI0029F584E6|nr:acyltransferase [uncultured Acetobacteroides sp.]